MGDISGLDYVPPIQIDRASLSDHAKEPEVRQYDFDGEPHVTVSWGLREISEPDAACEDKAWTSLGSPASEHLREFVEDGAEANIRRAPSAAVGGA